MNKTAATLIAGVMLIPLTPSPAVAGPNRCARLPEASAAQANTAEVQLRLTSVGIPLTMDGANGPRTKAGIRRWEAGNRRPVNGVMSHADIMKLRQQTSRGWSVLIDKNTQRIRVSRAGRHTMLVTATGSGQWYRSGNGVARASTPNGNFQIERRIDGWRQSALGCLYKPLYFVRGYAVHGSTSVPGRAVSHGCARVRIAVAAGLMRVLPNGNPVIVRGATPTARNTPSTPGK